MSEGSSLEKQLGRENLKTLKEKYALENELEQLKQDKSAFRRRGDFPAIEKANIREKEIKKKLSSLDNPEKYHKHKIEPSKINEQREKDRRKKQLEQRKKEQAIRNQMISVLNLMRQGKTRSQAAQSSGIPISRIDNWYREGKLGTTKDASSFYREVRGIEKEHERIERQHRQDVAKQKELDYISGRMRSIVNQMNKGKTREEAAKYVGVRVSDVNKWYYKGLRSENEMYKKFYNQLREIELRQKEYTSHAVSEGGFCPNCGKKLNNDDFNYCSSCGTSLKTGETNNKKKTTVKQNSSEDSSDDWISCCIAVFVIFIILGVLISLI